MAEYSGIEGKNHKCLLSFVISLQEVLSIVLCIRIWDAKARFKHVLQNSVVAMSVMNEWFSF